MEDIKTRAKELVTKLNLPEKQKQIRELEASTTAAGRKRSHKQNVAIALSYATKTGRLVQASAPKR